MLPTHCVIMLDVLEMSISADSPLLSRLRLASLLLLPRYYVKVVPTTYESLSGDVLKTNQFSVTEHFRQVSPREGQGLPGVFIFWGQNTCARRQDRQAIEVGTHI